MSSSVIPSISLPVAIAIESPVDNSFGSHQTPRAQFKSIFQDGMYNLGRTFALVIWFVLLIAFASVGFTLAIASFSIGVSLLPLAFIGAVLLTVFWYFVGPVARLDSIMYRQRKALYNSILDINHRN